MPAPPNAPPANPPPVRLDAALVRAHQNGVWRYLRFLGCPHDVAEDLTQEAFLVLLERPIADLGPAALDGWLRGVARNLWRARRRQLAREPGLDVDAIDPDRLEAAWVAYARDDAGDGYHAALRRCLARLDERARTALLMRVRDDAPRTAIAAALGVGDEGVKSVLRRAKDQLRTCIERRLHDERD